MPTDTLGSAADQPRPTAIVHWPGARLPRGAGSITGAAGIGSVFRSTMPRGTSRPRGLAATRRPSGSTTTASRAVSGTANDVVNTSPAGSTTSPVDGPDATPASSPAAPATAAPATGSIRTTASATCLTAAPNAASSATVGSPAVAAPATTETIDAITSFSVRCGQFMVWLPAALDLPPPPASGRVRSPRPSPCG